MKKLPFEGSAVALVTPFEGYGVNQKRLEELVNMHMEEETAAVVVCGTTGEASTMSDEEHISVIKTAVRTADGKKPIIAGTGSNDTKHAVMMSRTAEELGADALLAVTPYYNKGNEAGLVEHFAKIAESVSIPIILYNIPSRTGVSLSLNVLKRLSELDNIVGIKEASGGIAYVAEIAAQIPELYIYSGNDNMTVPCLSLGGKGVISAAANILPSELQKMCTMYFSGDTESARRLQLEIMPLLTALFCEVNPIPVKAAMNMLGYDVGKTRLPLGEMKTENSELLGSLLKQFGVIKRY